MKDSLDAGFRDPNPCRVIGVLDDGAASLDATALAHLRQAEVVIGARRQLQCVAAELRPGARQLDLGEGLSRVDRKSTRLNSSHVALSRMPSSA